MTPFLTRRGLMSAGMMMGVAACTTRGRLSGAGALIGAGDAPPPYGATPTARQWRWHGREKYAFVHFTINTFTDKEWGYGDESPDLFDPSDFDPDQIVSAAKAGGLNGLILTAKHHDGFCLWPTELTEHCIRNSPYKNGQGDIVGELEAACRRGGIAFGIYLSPWDRNHPEYARPAYIDYFRAQITELCTRYGELFEFWFDGANGGDGYYGGARETRRIDAPRYYNWPSMVALVHELQPMACTFDPLGADIRWVGNEDGVAGEPCWPTMPNIEGADPALLNRGMPDGALWWPAETNVSIRPGWFYHADENDRVKSPETLLELYATSVGRGTNFLLNLAPDKTGQVPAHDVAVLRSFGDAVRATYETNLADGAIATASSDHGAQFGAAFGANRVLDGNRETYWAAPGGATHATLTLDLPSERRFDRVRVGEYLPLGCRVRQFAIEVEIDGAWREIGRRQSMSEQAILHLDAPVAARRVRLVILDAAAPPVINEFALFRSVPAVPVARQESPESAILDPSDWTVRMASAPGAERLFDRDMRTVWKMPASALPARVEIDLGKVHALAGFSLTPLRHPPEGLSPPSGYVVETSLDGRTWQAAGRGEFSNIAYALATQRPAFDSVRRARFVRWRFDKTAVAAAEMGVSQIGLYSND